MPERSSQTPPRVDEAVALRYELRQWKLALGWWSGLPAQEAFDFWRQHWSGGNRVEADTSKEDDRG